MDLHTELHVSHDTVEVPVDDLTERQLLLAIFRLQLRMEAKVAELTEAVDALKGAVDGVAQRLLPQLEALEQALAAAQADDADAATALAEATAATAAIRTEVDRLNALGVDPTTPVEEEPAEPVDPPPVEVISEPSEFQS